ncbi:preprotein translocase subunit SecE [Lolliginicoccus suaedae]|uniref:preprotein translocase subunit SecE n=1 Tax=Lolliginicoccus suaedae TaxID=2605429 RepID=UPI0011ED9657|nr:preprotein translocase subunit SecE [Lolliginicoccus suaedae]
MSEQPGRRADGEENDPRSAGSTESGGAPRPTGKRAARSQGSSPSNAVETAGSPSGTEARENPFQLIARFIREVISELRKVIWPNRKQMVTYTIVVFIFLFFMVGLIFGLDQVFSRGVLWLYG